MVSVFHRFPEMLRESIVARLGWSELRPVQELAGHALLDGKNAVILAPTAGGKTEAAMFPALARMLVSPPSGVGVLYVAPLRALLNNQSDRLERYTTMVGLSRCVWHGDTPAHTRKSFLKEPTELLMTTPESLEVMLISPRVDIDAIFGDLRMVIIDEVHALAGTDRGAHLASVVHRLTRRSRHDVQRVGLSATVGNPDTILTWLSGTSARAQVVVDPPRLKARRELRITVQPDMQLQAAGLAQMAKGNKSLVFCQSRAQAELVANALARKQTRVFVHHSAVSREERASAEEMFHSSGDACIVSTSTLELGIDIGDLDRVFQIDAPRTVTAFMQRMGRTGRRSGPGATPANTTFMCATDQAAVQAIALIELAKSGWVESVSPSRRCWPVFVHQLIAMSLEGAGLTFDDAWRLLSEVPDFGDIRRDEAEALIAHMLKEESFVQADGRLLVGPRVEKKFGRQHFRELYAVFFSPRNYTVETTSGQVIGTLEQDFVDMLASGHRNAFLLGGRAWVLETLNHEQRQLVVKPAPTGNEPVWGAATPEFLGFQLCQMMRDVIAGSSDYVYLDDSSRQALARWRQELGEVLRGRGIETDEGEVTWWTFAGGRINWTLRVAMSAKRPDWSVVANNLSIRVRGERVSLRTFDETIRELSEPAFWQDQALWKELLEGLPNFRLSKFQILLPDPITREMVADYLLDVDGARVFLARRSPGCEPGSEDRRGEG